MRANGKVNGIEIVDGKNVSNTHVHIIFLSKHESTSKKFHQSISSPLCTSVSFFFIDPENHEVCISRLLDKSERGVKLDQFVFAIQGDLITPHSLADLN